MSTKLSSMWSSAQSKADKALGEHFLTKPDLKKHLSDAEKAEDSYDKAKKPADKSKAQKAAFAAYKKAHTSASTHAKNIKMALKVNSKEEYLKSYGKSKEKQQYDTLDEVLNTLAMKVIFSVDRKMKNFK